MTRILVVDDSALIRKVLERLLAERGLETLSFARADGAVDIDTASIGAAILDVEIEDQSGIELGRALLERDPSLPVSFLTGTTDPGLIREARALGPVFEKGDDSPRATWAGATAALTDARRPGSSYSPRAERRFSEKVRAVPGSHEARRDFGPSRHQRLRDRAQHRPCEQVALCRAKTRTPSRIGM